MRIAIVNDLPMAVEALKHVLSRAPEHSLAWIAVNGQEAVDQCARDRPDVILMDLMMPLMDGVEATRRIMQQTPCAILIVTASVSTNSRMVFEALSAGALDAVSTPVLKQGNNSGATSLLFKINNIQPSIHATPPPTPQAKLSKQKQVPLVVIGASAGGPAAVGAILAALPGNFAACVVIVQHLDAQFAPGLVSWLSGQSRLPVKLVREGDRFESGVAMVAGSNDHMILKSNGTLAYTPEPKEFSYRPSVDVFFESVRLHWTGEVVAVLLTGMGKDGAKGLRALRLSGVHTIAQSKEDCVVYGMPKAAADLDAAVEILNLDRIAATLTRRFAHSASGSG